MNAGAEPILATSHLAMVSLIVTGIVAAHWLMRARTLESALARTPVAALSLAWAAMAFTIVIAQGAGSAFIYFQF
jgi:alginate O-acetyltransferase complex protein AlgI